MYPDTGKAPCTADWSLYQKVHVSLLTVDQFVVH